MVHADVAKTSELFLEIYNGGAIFVAAISGAVAAIRQRADPFGVLVLSFTAACSGGILRDLLIGSVPPDNILSWHPLAISSAAAAVTICSYRLLDKKLDNPVQVFDACGLGLFTVLGAKKALLYGIDPLWSVLLGMITGIGGGIVRDMLLARMPNVLRREIYATASLAGGIIVVAGHIWPIMPLEYTMALGAVMCITLRLLALKFKWAVPVLPRLPRA